MVNSSSEKYTNLDGLRTAGALFVLLMHVYANGGYNLGNGFITRIIANGGEFVKMFFIISAFGMCCGYYDRFKCVLFKAVYEGLPVFCFTRAFGHHYFS